MKKNERSEMKRILHIVSSKKLLIFLIVLVFLTVGYIYSFYLVTPEYKSSATLLLAGDSSKSTNDNQLDQGDINLNKNLISTYSSIVKSNKILQEVIQNLNLEVTPEGLNQQVRVNTIEDTQIMEIFVVNENPQLAMEITNELATVFQKEIRNIYHIENVTTVDQAEVASAPYNVSHAKDLAIFGLLGIGAAAFVMILFYFFDNTIKFEKDIEDYVKVGVLGAIPKRAKKEGNHQELILQEDKKSYISECIRAIRTNLLYTTASNGSRSILMTSASSGEGKSWTSANLAVSFAQMNKKVILVDCDMRKGRLNRIFHLPNQFGLSNCLNGIEEDLLKNANQMETYIYQTQVSNLHVMTNGTTPPNPSELVSSNQMRQLLQILKNMYDVVILDGTPCLLVADSIGLSSMVDSTVIVTESRRTKIEQLKEVVRSIESVKGNLSGVILNKKKMANRTYKGGYYYANKEKEEKQVEEVKQEVVTVAQLVEQLKAKIAEGKFLVGKAAKQSKEEMVIPESKEKVFGYDNEPMFKRMDQIEEQIKKVHIQSKTSRDLYSEQEKRFLALYQELKQLREQVNIQPVDYSGEFEEISSQIEEFNETYPKKWEEQNQTNQEAILAMVNGKLEEMNEKNRMLVQEEIEQIKQTQAIGEIQELLVKLIEENQEILEKSEDNTVQEKLGEMKEQYESLLEQTKKQEESNEELQQISQALNQLQNQYKVLEQQTKENKDQEQFQIIRTKLEELNHQNEMLTKQKESQINYEEEIQQMNQTLAGLKIDYLTLTEEQNESYHEKLLAKMEEKLQEINEKNEVLLYNEQIKGQEQIENMQNTLVEMKQEYMAITQKQNSLDTEALVEKLSDRLEKMNEQKEIAFANKQEEYQEKIQEMQQSFVVLKEEYLDVVQQQNEEYKQEVIDLMEQKLESNYERNKTWLEDQNVKEDAKAELEQMNQAIMELKEQYHKMQEMPKEDHKAEELLQQLGSQIQQMNDRYEEMYRLQEQQNQMPNQEIANLESKVAEKLHQVQQQNEIFATTITNQYQQKVEQMIQQMEQMQKQNQQMWQESTSQVHYQKEMKHISDMVEQLKENYEEVTKQMIELNEVKTVEQQDMSQMDGEKIIGINTLKEKKQKQEENKYKIAEFSINKDISYEELEKNATLVYSLVDTEYELQKFN